MSRHARLRWITRTTWLGSVLAGLGPAGCSSGERVSDQSTDDASAACVQEDGVTRPVMLTACRSPADCPSGTQCQFSADCSPDTPCDGECRIDATIPGENSNIRSLLTTGFGARRFEAVNPARGQFVLDPPAGTIYVTCSTFRCLPTFPARATDENRIYITNFDECVVSREDLVATKPSVALLEMPPYVPMDRERCEESSVADDLERPRANGAWFGCWAYGETGIIGATHLHDVLDQVETVTLVPAGGCLDECETGGHCDTLEQGHRWLADYAGCVRDDQYGMGACVEGHCRGWCLTDEDCPLMPYCRGLAEGSCQERSRCHDGEEHEGEAPEDTIHGSILGLCEGPGPRRRTSQE